MHDTALELVPDTEGIPDDDAWMRGVSALRIVRTQRSPDRVKELVRGARQVRRGYEPNLRWAVMVTNLHHDPDREGFAPRVPLLHKRPGMLTRRKSLLAFCDGILFAARFSEDCHALHRSPRPEWVKP